MTVVSSLLIAVPEIVIAIALLAIAVRWRSGAGWGNGIERLR